MQELEKIKSSGTLKIGSSIQEGLKGAPWAWIDEQTKKILGFEVDICRAITKELNIKEEFIPFEGYRLIVGLANNKCDISIGALKPQNTMTGIIYTNPYYYLTQRIVSHKNTNIYDLVDLKGHQVGVLNKSLGEFIINEENKNLTKPIKVKTYNEVIDLFTALQFKEINAVFIDSPVALWYSKSAIYDDFEVSDVAYKSGYYSIAVKEENKELKDEINRALKKINTKEILEKYGLWDEAQQTC